jgi:hypothetical protein
VFANLPTFVDEERLEKQRNRRDGIRINGFSFDSSQTRNGIASCWKAKEKAVRVRKFGESE